MDMSAWTQTLIDYLGLHAVVPDFSDGHHMVRMAMVRLEVMNAAADGWPEVRLPHLPDVELRMDHPRKLVVRDRATGALIGGNTQIIPFVMPDFRGRGVTSEIHVLVDEMGARSRASTYSVSGLMARVRAHRLHVERALDRGEAVPEAVLSDYARDAAGRVRLRTPFDVPAYEALVAETCRRHELEAFSRITQDMTEVLHGPHDLGALHFSHFRPTQDGHALAVCLAEDAGATIRAGFSHDRLAFVQAEIGDVVIDVFGLRPEGAAIEELRRRGMLPSPDTPPDPFFGKPLPSPIEIVRFPDRAAFEAAIRPGDRNGPGVSFSEIEEGLLAEARDIPVYVKLLHLARRMAPDTSPSFA
jgi:hypothetical protein